MDTIKPEYGFDAVDNHDSIEYRVNQSPLGLRTGCLAFVVGPFIMWIPFALLIFTLSKLGIHINTHSNFFFYTTIFVYLIVPVGYIVFENYKRKTVPQRVLISKKFITVIDRKKTKQYDLSHVSDIILRNNSSNVSNALQLNNGVIVGGTGIAGVAAVGVGLAASTIKGSIDTAALIAKAEAAERGWKISIRYGSKDVVLLSSLTQNIGESLFQHICSSVNKFNQQN